MPLTDLTRISTSGIATGSTIDAPILRKDVDYRGSQVGVNTILFDSSENSLEFRDGAKATFGNDGDLKLYHNGSHSFIDETGMVNLYIRNGTKNSIWCKSDGQVNLYFNDVKKFETTGNGIAITGNATSSVSSLSDGSSITVDLGSASHFTVTLGGNRTFINSGMNTGNAIGSSGSIFIVQDGTGSRTAAFESAYKFPGGTAPTLSTAANAVDRLDFVVRSADNVHCVVTLDVK